MLVVFTVNSGGGDRAMVFVVVLVVIVMVAVVMGVGFPGGSDGKESACNVETWVQSLGWEDSLEEGMATTSVFLPGESHYDHVNPYKLSLKGDFYTATKLGGMRHIK